MRRIGACSIATFGAVIALGVARPAAGQTNVKVVVKEVTDDRISQGFSTGRLAVSLNLEGEGLDAVTSARILLKDAKDDTGKSLLPEKLEKPEFKDRNVNGGALEVGLENPPRSASSMRLSGTAELFVPGRDPNTVVKVPGFLSRLDKPVTSKGLKAAKVDVTVLSKEGYLAEQKKNALDDKKIAAIRAEGKAHGAKDEEIDAVIEMAKALQGMDDKNMPEHNLFLLISGTGDEKIQELWVESAAGEKLDSGSSMGSGGEAGVLKRIEYHEALPKDAVLAFRLFTDKAIVSVPFEVKEVQLP